MNYHARFYSLTGTPSTVRTETHVNAAAALVALTAYAEAAGFTRVQTVDDEDGYYVRVTATTPNGRAGRNIGAIEPVGNYAD